MSFSAAEVERYARHLVLRDVGGPGQQKLRAARVLVVGAGGLGAPLIQYLAAAGVGTIGILDDDEVTLSNLQRQVLFRTDDVGRPKTDAARDAVAGVNPHVQVVLHPVRLRPGNADELVGAYDVVADGSDNFDTRYAVSDACCRAGVPLVSATVNVFDGSLTTLRPFEKRPDGTPNPTYRCLFPQKPPAGLVPTCAEAGVLGALAGVVGSLQAVEVLRQIVGFGEGLVGRMLLVDGLTMRFETIEYAWDPANPLTGSTATA